MDTEDMEMQLIELKSSTLWVTKFVELRQQLEATPVQDHGAHILTCCASAPKKIQLSPGHCTGAAVSLWVNISL